MIFARQQWLYLSQGLASPSLDIPCQAATVVVVVGLSRSLSNGVQKYNRHGLTRCVAKKGSCMVHLSDGLSEYLAHE